jgi:hypothetical protein
MGWKAAFFIRLTPPPHEMEKGIQKLSKPCTDCPLFSDCTGCVEHRLAQTFLGAQCCIFTSALVPRRREREKEMKNRRRTCHLCSLSSCILMAKSKIRIFKCAAQQFSWPESTTTTSGETEKKQQEMFLLTGFPQLFHFGDQMTHILRLQWALSVGLIHHRKKLKKMNTSEDIPPI